MGKIIQLYDGKIHIPAGDNILVTGAYNILMAHHVRQFKNCKDIADRVIVGTNSSQSMTLYKPGNIQVPEKERLEILAALQAIDYVFTFDSRDASDAINILGSQGLIKQWAKGADYTIDKLSLEERTACDKYGIQITFTPLYNDTMKTSELIKKIKEAQ